MSSIDPSDVEWSGMRSAFERLVDLDAAGREAELAQLRLPEHVQHWLRRLLATADREEVLLVPGRPIQLPTPPPDDSAPFVLPHRLGRYELLAAIGRGSMGEVFRARDSLLERDVAVKVLTPSLVADPRWLLRFRREALAASALNHPNVMTVHDTGEHDGAHFLVAEFVAGQTLRERLRRGALPLDELLDCSMQIVGAVAAAHRAGIVHRDLKPENVMQRPDGLLKVLDFGLAKTVAAPLSTDIVDATAAGVLVGTLRYMAPEQARGETVDARTDVFALGALLYELAAGVPAFAGSSPLDVLVALLDREVMPLSRLRADLPVAYAEAVERALRKAPSERPATAAELLAALEAARAEPAVRAAAPPPPTVRYARSGDVNIAYQVLGSGPVDLVFVMGWISHLEWFWREPSFARFLDGLSRFARVILFDKRGTGLSDRVANDRLPTLEQRIDDVRAVMDEVGSRRAVLCGVSEGGPMCALFAAAHPQRTAGLVMIGSYARRLCSEDYPWGATPAQCEQFCREILATWGGPVGIEARAPSRAEDPAFRDWWAAYLRHGASPNAAVALTRMNAEIDIRPLLPTIGVPTLVVHRTGDRCLTVEQGRYLAAHIPGAVLVELPGEDHLPFVGDQTAIVDAIEQFVRSAPEQPTPERQLATLVRCRLRPGGRADTAGAWQKAAMQGDAVGQARSLVVGDGELLAVFDGPVRAIRAAIELQALAARLIVPAAVAVHIGEFAQRGLGIGGAVVDESEALVVAAPDGAVLVSGAVRDLVAGAGMRFVPASPVAIGGGPVATWLVAG